MAVKRTRTCNRRSVGDMISVIPSGFQLFAGVVREPLDVEAAVPAPFDRHHIQHDALGLAEAVRDGLVHRRRNRRKELRRE